MAQKVQWGFLRNIRLVILGHSQSTSLSGDCIKLDKQLHFSNVFSSCDPLPLAPHGLCSTCLQPIDRVEEAPPVTRGQRFFNRCQSLWALSLSSASALSRPPPPPQLPVPSMPGQRTTASSFLRRLAHRIRERRHNHRDDQIPLLNDVSAQ